MKNLKKLSRQEQKSILGGHIVGPVGPGILNCNTSADCAPGLCCNRGRGLCFRPLPQFNCEAISPIG